MLARNVAISTPAARFIDLTVVLREVHSFLNDQLLVMVNTIPAKGVGTAAGLLEPFVARGNKVSRLECESVLGPF